MEGLVDSSDDEDEQDDDQGEDEEFERYEENVQDVVATPNGVFHDRAFEDAELHNSQIVRIVELLGASGSGKRAIIKAMAEIHGIDDPEEIERMNSGESNVKLRVPAGLRSTLRDVGLGELLAPVNLITVSETVEVLVNADAWKDIEFEVALDSGSVAHVCSIDDCPGYRVGESPGGRRGQ